MKLGTETAENWYSHIPNAVCEHEEYNESTMEIKGYKQNGCNQQDSITIKKIHI
jgi:hypothetical protein